MVSNLCNLIHQMPSRWDKILTETNFKLFTTDSSPMFPSRLFSLHVTLHVANVWFFQIDYYASFSKLILPSNKKINYAAHPTFNKITKEPRNHIIISKLQTVLNYKGSWTFPCPLLVPLKNGKEDEKILPNSSSGLVATGTIWTYQLLVWILNISSS